MEVELTGGLGSSCSSLIFGEDTNGGEALGDTFGDILGDTFGGDDNNWAVGFCKRGPENNCGCSAETGLVDHGRDVRGPEKAYLLNFLDSEAASGSSLENKSPSARGGDNRVDAVLLLSLSTDCEFIAVGLLDISTPSNASFFSGPRGDGCQKLRVRPLKLFFNVGETGIPGPVEFELFGFAGVGNTYVLNFRVDDGASSFVFPDGSDFTSAKSGADWVPVLCSPLIENDVL